MNPLNDGVRSRIKSILVFYVLQLIVVETVFQTQNYTINTFTILRISINIFQFLSCPFH